MQNIHLKQEVRKTLIQTIMNNYRVKYKYGTSITITVLQLNSGSESEAIAKLKQSGHRDGTIIILSVEKA